MSWLTSPTQRLHNEGHFHLTEDGRVFENTTIQEFHYVKRCSEDGFICAEAVSLGDGHICLLQSPYDAVLPLHLVGSLGEQLSCRLLA